MFVSCTLYDMAHSRVNDRSADEPPNQELAVFIYLSRSHPNSFFSFKGHSWASREALVMVAKTLLRQREWKCSRFETYGLCETLFLGVSLFLLVIRLLILALALTRHGFYAMFFFLPPPPIAKSCPLQNHSPLFLSLAP